jgi:hypothetical protein
VSKPVLKLDWCSHEAAKYACEKWHYSRCYPRGKSAKVGVWEDGQFTGVVIYADSPNKDIGRVYGLKYGEVTELMRVALSSHAAPVTRIVAISLTLLQNEFPSLRLVVSFADPEQGHHGGIYQGGNWVYAGRTQPADEYIVAGRRMHGKSLRQTRSTHPRGAIPASNVLEWARKVIDPNARKVDGSSKHRYLMPLDDDMRKRIEPLRKPYPKRPRAAGVDSDTPGVQPGEGGATPTAALHTSPRAG